MKLFNVNLKCPFCNHEFSYNIVSLKAKHECENCKNDLIVRTKPMVSAAISMPGFFVLLSLREILGIVEMHVLINILYIVLGCLLYIGVSYKLVSMVKTPSFIYQVDAQDPTILERYKRNKKMNKK